MLDEVERRFEDSMVEFYPKYSGHQPWGYLWAVTLPCQECGRRFPVTGYVKNLPDGRVELVAEGERRDLEAFLAAIRKGMEGLIRETAPGWEDATGDLGSFDIAG